MDDVVRFRAALWRWEGKAGWHFITLPFDEADTIEERAVGHERGFGSVRVEATIGSSTWATSIFPDTKRKSYVLPVKKAVRTAEDIDEGDVVQVSLRLLDV